ncbi:unannotated protein [freshwater metagenome]|uniref:Unannotated protein n=1 Tax=freshwater metagenome TaxID=449393 RepID=A0A6J7SEC4_9ZZZZ
MIPSYDELPVHPKLGLPHSWGILDPNLGTLSITQPSDIAAAAAGVTEGEAIALGLSLGLIDPPLFGREVLVHSVYSGGDRNNFEDVLNSYNPQSSSQWDGFRHVRAREFGFYGGVTELAPDDTDTLSIEHFARHGVTGRGVLLDVAGWFERQGIAYDAMGEELIEVSTLEAVARDEGVTLAPGDILCIRMGWVAAYRALSPEGRASSEVSARFSGLRANEDTARYLWDNHVAAVCSDNVAIESAPGNVADGSLHRRLIPMLGFVFGEILDFDALALRCAELGRYTFLFVAAPLAVPGGLSSPVNAMAIL